jgi:integrase
MILAECPSCHTKQSVRNKACVCGEDLVAAKRGKRVKYWIRYDLPSEVGKRRMRQEAVGFSIEEARASEGKRKSQKREGRILDIRPDTKMTFKELTEWYLGLEKIKALSSFWRVELALKKFNTEFGGMIVSHIKLANLENYQAKRKKEGLADNTIDHEVGAAKSMIFKAFDNDMISAETLKTFKKVRKMLKRKSNARDKVITSEEYQMLFDNAPRHLKEILATAYYTGMRLGEILPLTWDKVDLKERVIRLQAQDTKDSEPRKVPICGELYEVFCNIPRAIHDNFVFHYKGKSVSSIKKSLKRVCEDSGILYGRFKEGGFTFHDLRHAFNTNMRKAGVPESVIMEITGHSTREMFDRYNTIDLEDARLAVAQLQRFLQSRKDDQKGNGDQKE